MITTRKIAAVTLLSLSFVAAAATVGMKSASNDAKVTITAQQQPSGDTMTIVTVTAKRLNAKDKIAAAFHDARDAMVKHG